MALVEPRQTRTAVDRVRRRPRNLEHKGVQCNRNHGAAQNKAVLIRRQNPQRHTGLPDDERELANLRQAGRDGKRCLDARGKRHAQHHVDEPLAHHDQGDQGEKLRQVRRQNCRIDHHAHRCEKDDREQVLERNCLCGDAVRQLIAGHHHAR